MEHPYYALPYFAAPVSLPAPLPSVDEIEASQDVLKHSWSHRVVRVGTHYIVKYGVGVQMIEGENMLFVKQSTLTRDGVMRNTPTTTNYIVMEYIRGETLDARWGNLDDAAKAALAEKLRKYFQMLRHIESPSYFGALGKRPFCDDGFVWHREDEEAQQPNLTSGPFDSEEQLLDALVASTSSTRAACSRAIGGTNTTATCCPGYYAAGVRCSRMAICSARTS
ncbi:hypothetical protein PG994_008389 [Apiospora phragmitis]|uniref:Uncharacterized protein n=1 Tax=Apiospora phragmitis TaxID=2905665 RepID=A0ABR1USW7_9PEZI